jgi:hypothetical protein
MDPITDHFYGGYSGLSESISLTTISDARHKTSERQRKSSAPKQYSLSGGVSDIQSVGTKSEYKISSTKTTSKPRKSKFDLTEVGDWSLTEVENSRGSAKSTKPLIGGNNIPINPYVKHQGEIYDDPEGQIGPSLDDRTVYRIKNVSDFKSPTKDDEFYSLSEARIQAQVDQSSELMDKYAALGGGATVGANANLSEDQTEESISGISSESESSINFGMDEGINGKRAMPSSKTVLNNPSQSKKAKKGKKNQSESKTKGIKIDLDENDVEDQFEDNIDDEDDEEINFTSAKQKRYTVKRAGRKR